MCSDIVVSAQRHVGYFEGRRFRFLSLELVAVISWRYISCVVELACRETVEVVEDCPGRADIPASLFLCQSESHSIVERQYSSGSALSALFN